MCLDRERPVGGSGGVNDDIPPLANRQVQFAQSIQHQPVNFMQQQTPPSNSVSMNSVALLKIVSVFIQFVPSLLLIKLIKQALNLGILQKLL